MCINNEKELNLVYIECAEMTSFFGGGLTLNMQKQLNLFDTECAETRGNSAECAETTEFDTECAETRGCSAECAEMTEFV